tara:strand:+ start:2170 stop:2673 length:504 start_codon:yes stop_codon:yes gene_type:complete
MAKRKIKRNKKVTEWQPLVRGYISISEVKRLQQEYIEAEGVTPEEALKAVQEVIGDESWYNDKYQVTKRSYPGSPPSSTLVHLSIRRQDRRIMFDWRDVQQIKNQLLGEEMEAVQLFPAESRLVDTANQYHLWGFDSDEFRFPFGYNERQVSEKEFGRAKQRSGAGK